MACLPALAQLAFAQGAWNTTGGDAQRTSWVRTDPSISVAGMQKPGFQLLWKVKVSNEARAGSSLSQAVELPRYIGYRGFRAYAFFAGSSDNVIALDSDLGRVEWTRHIDAPLPPATAACPGGMTAGVSRPTALDVNGGGAGRGGGRAGAAGRGAMSAVGEAGQGAVQIAAQAAGGGRGGRAGAAGASGGRGGQGGAAGASGGRGGGNARGAPAFGTNDLFVLASDGMLRPVYVSTGGDAQAAIPFLPANANASGLIFTESDAFASTSGNCGGVPNGVWSLDLTSPDKTVHVWKSNGGSVVGTAFSPDGTVYASSGDGDYSPASFSDSVVALEGKSLTMKDFFTPAKSDFTTAPVVFAWQGKELVAVANKDGRLYLLDAASLGGADHRTPLARSSDFGSVSTGALATWEEGGTRWILAPVSGGIRAATKFAGMNGSVTNGGVAAFKVVDQGGQPTLQPAWVSRDLTVPQTPAIVNGVVFAVSGGDAQHPAVLYALDGATGKDLWNSGTTMTSFARSGISGGAGQLYLGTNDSTVYAFGVPLVPVRQ
jgi:hypothetical protein